MASVQQGEVTAQHEGTQGHLSQVSSDHTSGDCWEVALCPLQVDRGGWKGLVLGGQQGLPLQGGMKERKSLCCPIA